MSSGIVSATALADLAAALDGGDRIDSPVSAVGADLVAVSVRFGVVPIVVVGSDITKADEQRLAASIGYYRELLGPLVRNRVRGVFVAPDLETTQMPEKARAVSIGKSQLRDRSWTEDVLIPMRSYLTDDELGHISAAVFPASEVLTVRRYSDSHRAENAMLRIRLDALQQKLATSPLLPAFRIQGGAGSGKTVVLIARAQWIANSYPQWDVLLLCFNDALRVALEAQVSHVPNIAVRTFREQARLHKIRIVERGEDAGKKNATAVERALAERRGAHSVDALLIDEGQDFTLPWLELAGSWVRPGRGGLTVSSDSSQGLYQLVEQAAIDSFFGAFGASEKKTVDLASSYRTTKQILEAAVHASGAQHTGVASALDGNNIQLIWASSLAEQSRCIAWEIDRLVRDESEAATYSDVGILFSNRYVLNNNPFRNHLTDALASRNVPFKVLAMGTKAEQLDGTEVTITTIHSAKGKDFSAVFVIGVEALKTGENPDAANEDDDHPSRATVDSRAAYVAMTRARDTLMLTYTKPNTVIERLANLEGVDKWNWPVDYPTEED